MWKLMFGVKEILWVSSSSHVITIYFKVFFYYYSWFNIHLHVRQSISMKDNGKLVTMRDFDEKIIWTCDSIPLVASYSKGSLSFFSSFFFIMVDIKYIFIFYCLFQATCNIQYGLFKPKDLDMKLPKESLET